MQRSSRLVMLPPWAWHPRIPPPAAVPPGLLLPVVVLALASRGAVALVLPLPTTDDGVDTAECEWGLLNVLNSRSSRFLLLRVAGEVDVDVAIMVVVLAVPPAPVTVVVGSKSNSGSLPPGAVLMASAGVAIAWSLRRPDGDCPTNSDDNNDDDVGLSSSRLSFLVMASLRPWALSLSLSLFLSKPPLRNNNDKDVEEPTERAMAATRQQSRTRSMRSQVGRRKHPKRRA